MNEPCRTTPWTGEGVSAVSIYDNREGPAYNPSWPQEYCDNPHILKWWTTAHDALIAEQISEEHWDWYLGITDKILSITPPGTVEAWKSEDPLCARWAWYNILMDFAGARATKLGLTESIREPQWKTCPMCGERFEENSLPYPLASRLGYDQLDFCSPCLRDAIWGEEERLSKEEVLEYLRDLERVLERVPSQDFGQGQVDLFALSTEERLELLKVLGRKPSVHRVKELFGSWLGALIEAGILEDGTRRTARGTQCIAKDGHVCLSLGEKTIDDLLHAHGILHEKEPHYPESNYRADFAVGDVFIEFFGLTGNPDYDAKTKLKKSLCRKHGIKLISIYPGDLVSSKKLERKLLTQLSA